MAESGRVYFLGDTYVDRVVRDGEVVYGRNMTKMSSYNPKISAGTGYATRLRAEIPEEIGYETTYTLSYELDVKNEASILISNYLDNGGQNGERYLKKGVGEIKDTWTNNTYEEGRGTGSINILFKRSEQENEINKLLWKVELGDIATPYTVAPEDLFPSAQTFPSFSEWPEEGGGY